MTLDRHTLSWNGWGWKDAPDIVGDRGDALWTRMAAMLGMDSLPSTPAVPLSEITLPVSRLDEGQLDELGGLLEPDRVKTDDYERAFHARGKSYPDMVHLRAGNLETAPDAVVYPLTAEEVLALIEFAQRENVVLIPYGGGSSVVGGVTPQTGTDAPATLTIDMSRMDQVLEIDEEARTARIQSGIYGPQLEEALQAKGYTLGHYPQSFEFSTLGGWIAHRGAGQQSNKYGKPEKWLVSAQLATPEGLWSTEGFPASAVGPQLTQLVIGSEGTLGIITEATVKISPVPETKDYRAYVFSDFVSGTAAVRELAQSGLPLAMTRLSDPNETFFFQTMQNPKDAPEESLGISFLLIGTEGDKATVESTVAATSAMIEGHGGMAMGEDPGKSWYQSRFASPYLRDPMMDRGIGIDTLETSTRWSNIAHLYEVVNEAISNAIRSFPGVPDVPPVVMTHISHTYPDGASLYFTYAFPQVLGKEMDQWNALKRSASNTLVENGGTISHHHGVGVDHLPWVSREKGPVGTALLRAIKKQIDPKGLLNPGKLIP